MKLRLFTFFIVLTLSFGAFSFYQYRTESSVELDAARAASDAQFLQSELGATRYQVFGEPTNPTVILVHSFNGFIESWQPNIQPLVDAGYQVVAYDLFGRGLSDRPDEPNDLMFFRKQLKDLLYALDIEGKVNLVALSMGGAIAIDFANQYPDKVESLSLMAPAGYPVNIPVAGQVARLPILGTYLMRLFGEVSLKASVGTALYNQDKSEVFWLGVKEQLQYEGFNRSIISTLRNYPLGTMHDIYESVGTKKIPTLLFWGKEDLVIPFENNELLRKAIPHALFYSFDQVGHALCYEVPEKVIPLLFQFLPKPEKLMES